MRISRLNLEFYVCREQQEKTNEKGQTGSRNEQSSGLERDNDSEMTHDNSQKKPVYSTGD